MPVYKKCCFCAPLRYGILIWGYLSLMPNCLVIVPDILVWPVMTFSPYIILVELKILVKLVNLDFLVLLIFATHRKNRRLLKIYHCGGWSVVAATFVLMVPDLAFDIMACWGHLPGYIYLFLELLVDIIYISLQLYILAVVRSEVLKMDSQHQVRFSNIAAEAECEYYTIQESLHADRQTDNDGQPNVDNKDTDKQDRIHDDKADRTHADKTKNLHADRHTDNDGDPNVDNTDIDEQDRIQYEDKQYSKLADRKKSLHIDIHTDNDGQPNVDNTDIDKQDRIHEDKQYSKLVDRKKSLHIDIHTDNDGQPNFYKEDRLHEDKQYSKDSDKQKSLQADRHTYTDGQPNVDNTDIDNINNINCIDADYPTDQPKRPQVVDGQLNIDKKKIVIVTNCIHVV